MKSLKEMIQEQKQQLESSEFYQKSLVNKANHDRLNELIEAVEETTGKSVYQIYGYESTIGKLFGILKTVGYAQSGRKEAIEVLGITEFALQKYLRNAGNPAYYDIKRNIIVEEEQMNVKYVKEAILELAVQMEVLIDIDSVNQEVVDKVFAYARNKAIEAKDDKSEMLQVAEDKVQYTE